VMPAVCISAVTCSAWAQSLEPAGGCVFISVLLRCLLQLGASTSTRLGALPGLLDRCLAFCVRRPPWVGGHGWTWFKTRSFSFFFVLGPVRAVLPAILPGVLPGPLPLPPGYLVRSSFCVRFCHLPASATWACGCRSALPLSLRSFCSVPACTVLRCSAFCCLLRAAPARSAGAQRGWNAGAGLVRVLRVDSGHFRAFCFCRSCSAF